ncbi:MAG: hypothetical protein ACOCP4_05485 [Candidatus Woesearchaeota archaeon]
MTEKKSKKNTEKSVSNTPTEEIESGELNGGRTVVLRDQLGEIVLSSSHENDTLQYMLDLAHNQKMRQAGVPPINIPKGPRSYHG